MSKLLVLFVCTIGNELTVAGQWASTNAQIYYTIPQCYIDKYTQVTVNVTDGSAGSAFGAIVNGSFQQYSYGTYIDLASISIDLLYLYVYPNMASPTFQILFR